MPRVEHKTRTIDVTTSTWDARELLVCLGVIHKDHKPDPEEKISVALEKDGSLVVTVETEEES